MMNLMSVVAVMWWCFRLLLHLTVAGLEPQGLNMVESIRFPTLFDFFAAAHISVALHARAEGSKSLRSYYILVMRSFVTYLG